MRAVHLCLPPLVSPCGLLSTDQKVGQTLRKASKPPRIPTCPGAQGIEGKTARRTSNESAERGGPGAALRVILWERLEVLTHLVERAHRENWSHEAGLQGWAEVSRDREGAEGKEGDSGQRKGRVLKPEA